MTDHVTGVSLEERHARYAFELVPRPGLVEGRDRIVQRHAQLEHAGQQCIDIGGIDRGQAHGVQDIRRRRVGANRWPRDRVCLSLTRANSISRQMDITTTTDIVLVAFFLAGMALFGLAMLAVALRVGPRRGFWNQPAAALRAPGRRMFIGMYAVAILHVLTGLGVALLVPGGGIGIFLVLLATAVFYVLCAHSWALAHAVRRRRERA